VYFGYYKNYFSPRRAWLSIFFIIGYATTFLLYRNTIGSIEKHVHTEAWYPLLASVHGTLALSAIALACYVFKKAQSAFRDGMNYFEAHPRTSVALTVLWVFTLVSGLLM
jgi:hypothetical protein